uniref:Uncharacterized protein n=1 Tax=Tanacetum cinerariifolium TaxID=118510 RepID=A0A699K786_TANCI|nr:hypothetical protein [Tanacetum cinerariifolium]
MRILIILGLELFLQDIQRFELKEKDSGRIILRYDGDECDKGILPTKIELTLEQSQQGVSNDVLVSIEAVEELKRNVWIKGENKAALHYTLGDANREVPINETFHEQTDDEITEKELKLVEADDQAIQTILLSFPKDIYVAVDSCETAKEIWFTSTDRESIESYYHHFSKLMNDFKRYKHFPEMIASNLKFVNNLQPKLSQHVTIVHQTKDFHTTDYTQLYDFLKYNQKEVDELRAE